MKPSRRRSKPCTVQTFCDAMERIAPPSLAQSWDNVGLLAGDPKTPISRVLLCIDLTQDVAQEAAKKKAELVLAYHPPIFSPMAALRADSFGTDAIVFTCIKNGIAIYSTHTALDAAQGGTNDVMASLCGCAKTDPLAYVDTPGHTRYKLVVFVPPKDVNKVAKALFDAGAGNIGDYAQCSFRSSGTGSFLGGEGTNPHLGRRGRLEFVDEIRLETVVDDDRLASIVQALRSAQPYEEPAFDIYPLKPAPTRGIGRVGLLERSTTLGRLVRRLRDQISAPCTQVVGKTGQRINRVVVVVGAAGSLPFKLKLTPQDCVVTGEIRHHDALTIRRFGASAIALSHWASERPVLKPLAQRLRTALPGVSTILSTTDRDPFSIL